MSRLLCLLVVVCLVFGAEAKKKTHLNKLKALKKSMSDLEPCPNGIDPETEECFPEVPVPPTGPALQFPPYEEAPAFIMEAFQKFLDHRYQKPIEAIRSELDRITAVESEIESVRSELSTVRTAALRMCQTGEVKCEGDCGGNDPDGKMTTTYFSVSVTFSPTFNTYPTVNMATSRIWMHDPTKANDWGFYHEVKDLSLEGFTARLYQEDAEITWQSAVWIACGEVVL